jgi:hypothetical protein
MASRIERGDELFKELREDDSRFAHFLEFQKDPDVASRDKMCYLFSFCYVVK